MNWDAVGAGAEVLAAIAVILTLLYLARQLQKSNMLARENAQYHVLQNQISYYDRLAENADCIRNLSDAFVCRLTRCYVRKRRQSRRKRGRTKVRRQRPGRRFQASAR